MTRALTSMWTFLRSAYQRMPAEDMDPEAAGLTVAAVEALVVRLRERGVSDLERLQTRFGRGYSRWERIAVDPLSEEDKAAIVRTWNLLRGEVEPAVAECLESMQERLNDCADLDAAKTMVEDQRAHWQKYTA